MNKTIKYFELPVSLKIGDLTFWCIDNYYVLDWVTCEVDRHGSSIAFTFSF